VEFDLSLKVGEPLLLPDGRTLLADFQKKTLPESIDLAIFDATVLQFPLQVRSLQPGDRFRPSGMKGHRKIKDFLIDLKVEKELRLSLPLLLNQGQILWLVGLRRSALFPVTSEVRKSLVVRLLEA
jgi:tRNA(Ile)-lysidine synthase